MVTVGGVADQAEIDKARIPITPKTLESFILQAPMAVMKCALARQNL
jgi:hypothetical protein